jgi:hypothetical protein
MFLMNFAQRLPTMQDATNGKRRKGNETSIGIKSRSQKKLIIHPIKRKRVQTLSIATRRMGLEQLMNNHSTPLKNTKFTSHNRFFLSS